MSEEKSIQNQPSSEDSSKKVVALSTPTSSTTEPKNQKQPMPAATSVKVAEDKKDHHTHLHHEKRWVDYLFEFMMVFLAVILGFLFENLREHYVEHQRAQEYAQSLYNDLKKDAEAVNYLTDFKKWRSRKLDSLMIVTSPTAIQAKVPDAYYYSCFLVIPNPPFRPSDITIQQLRNSGTLRYFAIPLINRITHYYSNCDFYTGIENEYRQMMPPYSLSSKIFDADLLASLFSNTWQPDLKNEIHWPDAIKRFKLLSSYQQTLNEYRLYVGKQKRGNDGMIMLLYELVEKPRKELMKELQKQYSVH